MRSPAIAKEIEDLLGDVDPFIIERILDTHANVDEIVEALADLEDEQHRARREPLAPRVVEVRAILEELDQDDDDEAYAS